MINYRIFLALLITIFILPENGFGQYQATILPGDSNWKIAHQQLSGNIMMKMVVHPADTGAYSLLYFYFVDGIDSIYAGKIIEDVEQGKLWYIEPDSTSEKLIFDLELQLNDSFISPYFNNSYMYVESIFEVGERKYIEFDAQTKWDEPVRFIEGVGPNIGLLWLWLFSGILDPIVVCKFENEELVFSSENQNFMDCDFNTLSIKEIGNVLPVKVFPNPAKDHFSITVNRPDVQIIEIRVINQYGLVMLITTEKSSDLTLNTENFKSGIYFIEVKLNNKTNYYQKIIIN